MSLLEAFVALIVAAGIITTAAESFALSTRRSVATQHELAALLVGESILARAGEDRPLRASVCPDFKRGEMTCKVSVADVEQGLQIITVKIAIRQGSRWYEKSFSSLREKTGGD